MTSRSRASGAALALAAAVCALAPAPGGASLQRGGDSMLTGGQPAALPWRDPGASSGPDPTLQQRVGGLTPGLTYRVTGNYANAYGCCGNLAANSFAVDADGVARDQLDFPCAGVHGAFTFDIVAAGSELLIAFHGGGDGDDADCGIDDISVSPADASLPEPSSLTLLGLGPVSRVTVWRTSP